MTVLKHATEKIFRAMSQRDEIIEQIYDFIHGSESNEMYSVMVELVNRLGDNIDAEERSEDETWFDGLSQSFNTKDDVMRYAAKSRVRKYLCNAKESFEKVSSLICCLYDSHKNCNDTVNQHDAFTHPWTSGCSLYDIMKYGYRAFSVTCTAPRLGMSFQ